MRSMRCLRLALGMMLVGVLTLGVACSDSGSDATSTVTTEGTTETSGTRVDVTVTEWSVTPDPVSVPAGEVRFFVNNAGSITHEFVVEKSDADPAALPVYVAGDTPAEGHAVGDVDEAQIASEGEVEDIEPGSTKDATFTLDAGKYVLLCNLAAHYGQGMRVAFTIE